MQTQRAYNTGMIAAMIAATLVELITGIVLLPFYDAKADSAYASISAMGDIKILDFLRNVHHWSSALIIVLGTIYILAGLFRGAYQKPGQWLWIGSIALFLLSLGMQITGHLLPMDQQAVRTAVVETGIAADAPVVGTMQANLMRGGESVGPATLHLWYVAHVAIFSVLLVGLLVWLFLSAKKVGVSLKRSTWMLGSLAILLLMSIALKAPFGQSAAVKDFADSGARPEWYILPLHSLLVIAQSLKPTMAFVGTMLIPGIAVAFLILLPWLHKKEKTSIARGLGVVGTIAIVGLYAYSFSDVAPPVGDQIVATINKGGSNGPTKLDPKIVAQGKTLFAAQGCDGCHVINGRGDKVGPDLSDEGSKGRGVDWQERHLVNPKDTTPGSTMPSFKNLKKVELGALGQYLESLKKS